MQKTLLLALSLLSFGFSVSSAIAYPQQNGPQGSSPTYPKSRYDAAPKQRCIYCFNEQGRQTIEGYIERTRPVQGPAFPPPVITDEEKMRIRSGIR